MKPTTTPPASGALRIVHATVFLGFAAATVAATHQELLQLWRGLSQPFHAGTEPALLPTACAIVAALGALFILLRVAMGKRVPLFVSALMLLAFGLSFTVLMGQPAQRTVPGANLKALEAARAVKTTIDAGLQKTGRVPEVVALPAGTSPFRRRGFAAMPWHLVDTKRTDALPDGAEPGWILLNPTADRVGYTLGAVGIDASGEPAILRDEHGVAVELKGVFNPDTAG